MDTSFSIKVYMYVLFVSLCRTVYTYSGTLLPFHGIFSISRKFCIAILVKA